VHLWDMGQIKCCQVGGLLRISAHVKHSLLDVLAGVHEVANDANSLVVDADIVGSQHLDQRGQCLRAGARVSRQQRIVPSHRLVQMRCGRVCLIVHNGRIGANAGANHQRPAGALKRLITAVASAIGR